MHLDYQNVIETAIRLGVVTLVIVLCFRIVDPFLVPILWGLIIAVAANPLFVRLVDRLGGKRGLSATLVCLVAVVLLVVPAIMLAESTIGTSRDLGQRIEQGTLDIPGPSEKVRDWPLIGQKTYDFWSLASTNLDAAIDKAQPQLKALGSWLVGRAAAAGGALLQTIVAIIIAGFFLTYTAAGHAFAQRVGFRLGGDNGANFIDVAGATIRSVAQGVLGVAIIQGLLGAIGMAFAGVPGAGLWALILTISAVLQLPGILVLGPVIAYVFSTADTTTAVLFTIWALPVSFIDGVLKPLLLGRGLDVPMPVILIGALGGMILLGIIGLFIGAIVLTLGYTLFMAWLDAGERDKESGLESTADSDQAAEEGT
jgi:predicted PurR-regulated permease PerM